jgi:hypothetical protein
MSHRPEHAGVLKSRRLLALEQSFSTDVLLRLRVSARPYQPGASAGLNRGSFESLGPPSPTKNRAHWLARARSRPGDRQKFVFGGGFSCTTKMRTGSKQDGVAAYEFWQKFREC